jgi:deoxyribose-phosphate aldolase
VSQKINKEIDRYHEVNAILKDLERSYKRIETIKSRAYGQKHLNAIADELSLTQEQIAANERLKAEAEAYLVDDKAGLAKFGAAFDSEGRIENYEEMQRTWAEWYHTNINSTALGEQQKEDIEKLWDEF